MITFLKNVGRYTHSKLRNKKFEEVQVLYEKAKKSIQDFVPVGSVKDERLVEKMNKKVAGKDTSKNKKVLGEPDSTKMEVKQEEVKESTRKRPGTILKYEIESIEKKAMEAIHKAYYDLEEEEHLKTFLKIVPNEEGIVDYEILEKRFPRFETTTLEGVDLVLWGDLRTMFDANAEDELWQNQGRSNLKSWDFYENYKVHTLILEDGTEIHMLAERKYPLIKETLKKMMYLKLVDESASDGAYNLLKSIQKHIDESGSYDGSEKDL
ncbi:hypothetical protein Tco_0648242 [Tanacetum coccineum]